MRRHFSTLLRMPAKYAWTPTDVQQLFFTFRRDGEEGKMPFTYVHPRHGAQRRKIAVPCHTEQAHQAAMRIGVLQCRIVLITMAARINSFPPASR